MIKDFLTKKITRRNLESFISKYSLMEKKVLDLGCGASRYAHYFKNRIGFDIKPREEVDVVGDAHQLPFKSDDFDLIICTEVLEHLHTPALAIKEMNRVLKKNGLLILSTRFIFPIHDSPNDYFRYTIYGLKKLFEENWEIIELQAESSTKDTFAILLQRIGFQTNLRGDIFTKFILFSLAKIIEILPSLIKKEFGDINHSSEESNILTSGYYLVCRKI